MSRSSTRLRKLGTVIPSRINIVGGSPNGVADFKPSKAGTSLSASGVPPGFSPPPSKYADVVASIAPPGIAITEDLTRAEPPSRRHVGLGESPGPQGLKVTSPATIRP